MLAYSVVTRLVIERTDWAFCRKGLVPRLPRQVCVQNVLLGSAQMNNL